MSFNTIGFFQFDNLLRNRVPLVLIILDEIDLNPWYDSLTKMHLEVVSHHLNASQIQDFVKEKKVDPQFGILILDLDGEQSKKAAETLDKAGYLNAFYVPGGYQQLLTEKNQNKN